MAFKYPKSERVQNSRALMQVPCVLFSVTLTAAGGGTGIIKIHNGGSSDSPELLTLYVSTPDSKTFPFPEGLYLSRGCYVEIVSNVTEVLVQIKQVD